MAFWRKKNEFDDEHWNLDDNDWLLDDEEWPQQSDNHLKFVFAGIVLLVVLCVAGWFLKSIFVDETASTAASNPDVLPTNTVGSVGGGIVLTQQAVTNVIPTAVSPQTNIPLDVYDPDVLAVWMLDMINADRAANGLAPVTLDETAAFAGTLHSKDMLQNSYFSHWNQDGFGPEHRYAQVGGADVVMENLHAFSYTYDDGRAAPIENWQEVIQNAQTGLMNSPGHRANILDPAHTHVGIGMAYDPETGQFRLAQEFTNQYVQLDQALPVQAALGNEIGVNGRLISPPAITNILLDLAYEPFPNPMSREELNQTSTYTSRAESLNTIVIPVTFHEIVTIDADGDPGFYHIRIFGDLDTGQALLMNHVIVVR